MFAFWRAITAIVFPIQNAVGTVLSWCYLCPQERHADLWTHIISPHFGQIHFTFSFRMKCLIPNSFIILRLSIMLIAYLVLYRLSNCFNLAQGKRSQLSEQYLIFPSAICLQFLILHLFRYFDFWLSRLSFFRQPEHLFFSRMYPQQRRQFIPQGAIKIVGIVVVIFHTALVFKFPFTQPICLPLPRFGMVAYGNEVDGNAWIISNHPGATSGRNFECASRLCLRFISGWIFDHHIYER